MEQPSVSGSMIDATTNHSVPKSTLYKRDMTRMFEMSSPRAIETTSEMLLIPLSRNNELPSKEVKTLPESERK